MTTTTIREMTEQDTTRIQASARRFVKKYGNETARKDLEAGKDVQEVIDSVLAGYDNELQRKDLARKWTYMQSRSFEVDYNKHLSFQNGKIVIVVPAASTEE